MLLILLFIFIFVGAGMFVIGRRGRRVDDHPWCRQCGFDLFNSLPTLKACPECGADLTQPKAVRIGQRKRRPRVATAGLLLAIVGVLGLGNAALSFTGNWQTYKPVWQLRMEANLGSVNPAMAELSRRLTQGQLSQPQIDAIADDALAVQADLNQPWSPGWGDFVEAAHAQGVLPPAKWRQYGEQVIDTAPQWRLRPRIRQGDPVGSRMVIESARVGNTGELWLQIRQRSMSVGSVQLSSKRGVSAAELFPQGGVSWRCDFLEPAGDERLAVGRHQAKLEVEATFGHRRGAVSPVKKKLTLTAPVEILPPDKPSLTVITDPARQVEVEAAIAVDRVMVGKERDGSFRLWFTLHLSKPPVGLAFDVMVNLPNQQVAARQLVVPAGEEGGWGFHASLDASAKLDEANQVDLEFRPNRDQALRSVDLQNMWGKPIILRNIPVRRWGRP